MFVSRSSLRVFVSILVGLLAVSSYAKSACEDIFHENKFARLHSKKIIPDITLEEQVYLFNLLIANPSGSKIYDWAMLKIVYSTKYYLGKSISGMLHPSDWGNKKLIEELMFEGYAAVIKDLVESTQDPNSGPWNPAKGAKYLSIRAKEVKHAIRKNYELIRDQTHVPQYRLNLSIKQNIAEQERVYFASNNYGLVFKLDEKLLIANVKKDLGSNPSDESILNRLQRFKARDVPLGGTRDALTSEPLRETNESFIGNPKQKSPEVEYLEAEFNQRMRKFIEKVNLLTSNTRDPKRNARMVRKYVLHLLVRGKKHSAQELADIYGFSQAKVSAILKKVNEEIEAYVNFSENSLIYRTLEQEAQEKVTGAEAELAF